MEKNAALRIVGPSLSRIPYLLICSVSHGLTPSSPIPAAVSDRVKLHKIERWQETCVKPGEELPISIWQFFLQMGTSLHRCMHRSFPSIRERFSTTHARTPLSRIEGSHPIIPVQMQGSHGPYPRPPILKGCSCKGRGFPLLFNGIAGACRGLRPLYL